MKTILILLILYFIFRIFLYRKFRIWLALRRRKGVYKRLIDKIKSLKKFSFRKNKKIPYIEYFGVSIEDAKVVYVITSIMHGLEDITGEIHVEFLRWLNKEELLQKKYCIMSIPIMNHWGLKNGARTTKDGVDLLRNSPYVSKYPKRKIILSGWNNRFFMVFNKVIGFAYYCMGIGVHKILKEFYKELQPVIRSKKPIVFFDLHTGNNRAQTTLWAHELFKRKFSKRVRRVCKENNIHIEQIPYATDGAIMEYIIEKYPDQPIHGYTIEFDVLEKEGPVHYAGQSFYGDVFAPPVHLRNDKMLKGMHQLAALLNLKLNNIY